MAKAGSRLDGQFCQTRASCLGLAFKGRARLGFEKNWARSTSKPQPGNLLEG